MSSLTASMHTIKLRAFLLPSGAYTLHDAGTSSAADCANLVLPVAAAHFGCGIASRIAQAVGCTHLAVYNNIAHSIVCTSTNALQYICKANQWQTSQLKQMTGLHWHQISACSAQSCGSSGMSTGTCTWVQSRSSHKVISRLRGSATSAQLDSHTSGRQLYTTEHEATSAPTAVTSVCACIIPLLQ